MHVQHVDWRDVLALDQLSASRAPAAWRWLVGCLAITAGSVPIAVGALGGNYTVGTGTLRAFAMVAVVVAILQQALP
jgi:hypothetical protein